MLLYRKCIYLLQKLSLTFLRVSNFDVKLGMGNPFWKLPNVRVFSNIWFQACHFCFWFLFEIVRFFLNLKNVFCFTKLKKTNSRARTCKTLNLRRFDYNIPSESRPRAKGPYFFDFLEKFTFVTISSKIGWVSKNGVFFYPVPEKKIQGLKRVSEWSLNYFQEKKIQRKKIQIWGKKNTT